MKPLPCSTAASPSGCRKAALSRLKCRASRISATRSGGLPFRRWTSPWWRSRPESCCFSTRARRHGFAASTSRSTRSPAASPGRRTASATTTSARKEFSRNRSSSGTNFAPCSVIAPRKKSSATADRAWPRATIFLPWSLPDCAAPSFTPARGASGLRTRRDRAKRVDEADSSWQRPQRRRRIAGEGQAGSVQDHRHQRVIAAQRKKLERAVEAEPVAHRGEGCIADAPAGVGLATESVDGGLLGRQTCGFAALGNRLDGGAVEARLAGELLVDGPLVLAGPAPRRDQDRQLH